ncbi:hypothetical protein SAMN05421878_1164 [Actinobaculum suis]|uniref:Uncharacterized protein n=1 Tax=Actinobaculum suis TaxID=1657 RepID=A0A1G7E9R8_9ACTO|nr:hypothetical protein SAMN05421878_1164 [Actinobaculum suis]VDG76561.1 Uncharacterised protein [Actinobaculum suis]
MEGTGQDLKAQGTGQTGPTPTSAHIPTPTPAPRTAPMPEPGSGKPGPKPQAPVQVETLLAELEGKDIGEQIADLETIVSELNRQLGRARA